jgi:hypothetical protein
MAYIEYIWEIAALCKEPIRIQHRQVKVCSNIVNSADIFIWHEV